MLLKTRYFILIITIFLSYSFPSESKTIGKKKNSCVHGPIYEIDLGDKSSLKECVTIAPLIPLTVVTDQILEFTDKIVNPELEDYEVIKKKESNAFIINQKLAEPTIKKSFITFFLKNKKKLVPFVLEIRFGTDRDATNSIFLREGLKSRSKIEEPKTANKTETADNGISAFEYLYNNFVNKCWPDCHNCINSDKRAKKEKVVFVQKGGCRICDLIIIPFEIHNHNVNSINFGDVAVYLGKEKLMTPITKVETVFDNSTAINSRSKRGGALFFELIDEIKDHPKMDLIFTEEGGKSRKITIKGNLP